MTNREQLREQLKEKLLYVCEKYEAAAPPNDRGVALKEYEEARDEYIEALLKLLP